MRVIAACLSFFIFLCRLLDITAPVALCVVLFSDKYLKKWYQLPECDPIAVHNRCGSWFSIACLAGAAADGEVRKSRRAI
jgi:hypothetical protein